MSNDQTVNQRDYQKEKIEQSIINNHAKAKRNVIFLIPLLLFATIWYVYTKDILLLIIMVVLFILQLNIVVMGTIIMKSKAENEKIKK